MADKVNCTVVSGAPNDCSEYLKDKINRNSFIIAADSGYKQLLKAGIKPDLIIADFDSSEYPDSVCKVISFPSEKSFTDTFNCVIYAVENGYKDITVFNAIGCRFDHTYGNVLCLDYCNKHGVKWVIQDRHNRLSLINKEYRFTKEYENLSLFAFLEDVKGVRIKGAYYTQDWYSVPSLDIKQGEQTAISNYINSDECVITVESGTLLLAESND